jgi:hypothetical protein
MQASAGDIPPGQLGHNADCAPRGGAAVNPSIFTNENETLEISKRILRRARCVGRAVHNSSYDPPEHKRLDAAYWGITERHALFGRAHLRHKSAASE